MRIHNLRLLFNLAINHAVVNSVSIQKVYYFYEFICFNITTNLFWQVYNIDWPSVFVSLIGVSIPLLQVVTHSFKPFLCHQWHNIISEVSIVLNQIIVNLLIV